MSYSTEKFLPVLIPGTRYIIDATPDEHAEQRFISDYGKSFLHILCEGISNPKSTTILQPDSIHRLWNALRTLYEDGEDSMLFASHDERIRFMRKFYSQNAKTLGADYGDIGHTLEQLHWEMRYNNAYMNAIVVVRNRGKILKNLGEQKLPVSAQPVSVRTPAPISVDRECGVSLKEFRKAGGYIVAGETCAAPLWVSGDDYFDDVNAVMWKLGHCEVDGPSNTFDLVPIDIPLNGVGVLRGRLDEP